VQEDRQEFMNNVWLVTGSATPKAPHRAPRSRALLAPADKGR
jgi:hypothetical protein